MNNKILSIAACLFALAACNKAGMEQDSDNHLPEEYKFREGQEVTLDISTDQTRATSVVNSSKIDFKWEAGDKIK